MSAINHLWNQYIYNDNDNDDDDMITSLIKVDSDLIVRCRSTHDNNVIATRIIMMMM